MKKNNFVQKVKGFSIAYAVVGLVVTAIAIIAITPVLTRKLNNLATSAIIKNPKGWYESYYAYPERTRYCKECKDNDEHLDRNHKPAPLPWPEYTGNDDTYFKDTIPEDGDGDPSYNPYVHPSERKNAVPYERYCKSKHKGECGYPEEKWTEEEKNAENKPDPKKPHRCINDKCKFKPAKGITKYEVYAIGGGGGSGSAINQNSDNKNKGKAENQTLIGEQDRLKGTKISEEEYIVPKFIDVKRITEPNTNTYLSDYTFKEGDLGDGIMAWDYFYTVGTDKVNFHVYPTEAVNSTLGAVHKKSIEKILQDKNKKDGREELYSKRYYWYTKTVGALKYNQAPELALMPEWLNIMGDKEKGDSRYKCTSKKIIDKGCLECKENSYCDIPTNGYDTKEGGTTNPIVTYYSKAVSVACSGKGQKGAKITYNNNIKICNWMKPNQCYFKGLEKEPLPKRWAVKTAGRPGGTITLCSTNNRPPSSNEEALNDASKFEDGGLGRDFKYCEIGYPNVSGYGHGRIPDANRNGEFDIVMCMYDKMFYNRKCTYTNQINNNWVDCTCNIPDEDITPSCNNNNDIIDKCSIGKGLVRIDPSKNKEWLIFVNIIWQHIKDHTEAKIYSYIRSKHVVPPIDEIDSSTIPSIGTHIHTLTTDPIPPLLQDSSKSVGGYSIFFENYRESYEDALNYANINFGQFKDWESPSNPNNIRLYIESYGRSEAPVCTRTTEYLTRNAHEPGEAGIGTCGYVAERIVKNGLIKIKTDGNPGDASGVRGPFNVSDNHNNNNPVEYPSGICSNDAIGNYNSNIFCNNEPCYSGKSKRNWDDDKNKGENAKDSTATIINQSGELKATAEGGRGGHDGIIHCQKLCNAGQATEKGPNGPNGDVLINGTYIDKNSHIENGGEFKKSILDSETEKPINGINGTQHSSGRYNWRYRWQMPYVTKHLMFGTAGEGGKEEHTMINLNEDQTLDITPGKPAPVTEYTSGNDGKPGGESSIFNKDAGINLTAKGGAGGKGSQQTEQYLLCHISDKVSGDAYKDRPCYYEGENDSKNSNKRTHEFREKYIALIEAARPKLSTLINSFRMTDELKKVAGRGGMGYGTKSVSDFVCEERKVYKVDDDKIKEGENYKYKNIVTQGGHNNLCNGNTKIKYILPHAADYTPGTGAVIILW